jgi:DNA-binding NtrC family response regulator
VLTLEEAREKWLAPLERQYLTDLLARHAGNVKAAARSAGINTVTLYRLLKRRGLHLGRTLAPAGRTARSRITD